MDAESSEIGKIPASPTLPTGRQAGRQVWVLAMLLPVVAMVTLGVALGSVPDFAGAMVLILTDGVIALLVLVAGGGYGWAVLRLFRPDKSSTLLCLATASALGLWMLSTAVLLVGSLAGGMLTMYLWWPVVGAGVILAAGQARRPLTAIKLRRRFTPGVLLWIPIAIAAGLWLAGAVMPPGWLGNLTMDSYDVLEYHLQLPREYYHAGSITTLNHNVYSHYPLGTEMLFLLGMCLRGGAYEGMHLGKLMVGLFGVIMIAGVSGGAGFKRRAAAVLLVTSPWVIYLSGLAMVEPAQFCYLALALLWLRRWLKEPSARTAVIIGAMLGAACAVKYLSVGLVAGPVLVVMLIVCLVRYRRRIVHVALAGGVAALLFSPWLIRNAAATGNPVFPLAMGLFGQGHFSDESVARWRDGHAPGCRPPIPKPTDYKPPERSPSRSERFFAFWSGQKPYDTQPAPGAGVLLLACAAVILMLVRPRELEAWYWGLLGVLVIQVLVWVFFTRDMPARFIAPAIVPLSLLAAGGLQQLWRDGVLRKAIAVALLIAVSGWGLASAWNYFGDPAQNYFYDPVRRSRWGPVRLPGPTILIGEARTFYFPPGTVYATVFDEHPLASVLRRGGSSGEVADEIRRMGMTHVLVSWMEIDRLAYSYGWPEEMSAERLRELFSDWKVIDELPPDRPVFTLYSLER